MNPDKAAAHFFRSMFHNRPNGFPVATVAYYGPDNETATKVAVGIVDRRDEVIDLKRWFVRTVDVRLDRSINNEILSYVKENHVQRVVLASGILGCPHEEGVDYPLGAVCPQCPYWSKVDRWTGQIKSP